MGDAVSWLWVFILLFFFQLTIYLIYSLVYTVYFIIQKLSSTNLGKLYSDGVRLEKLLCAVEVDRFQNLGFLQAR